MVCAPVRRKNPRALARGIIDRAGAQIMLYLTSTTITSGDLVHYGVSGIQGLIYLFERISY